MGRQSTNQRHNIATNWLCARKLRGLAVNWGRGRVGGVGEVSGFSSISTRARFAILERYFGILVEDRVKTTDATDVTDGYGRNSLEAACHRSLKDNEFLA